MISYSRVFAWLVGAIIGEVLIYIFSKKKPTVLEMIEHAFSTVGFMCTFVAIIKLLVR